MKKYLIPVFILSTFLSAHCGGCGVEEKKIIENVVYNIGTVKIEITPHSLILSNNETFSETFNYHTERWGDKDFIISHSGIYFYHLNDWKEPIECMDFKPTKNNSHVVDMTTANFEYHYQKAKIKELNNEDFVKFSFFNEEKTSIGFFFGTVGASSGGGRVMIFNTENNEHIIVPTKWCGTLFEDTGKYPPIIKDKSSND